MPGWTTSSQARCDAFCVCLVGQSSQADRVEGAVSATCRTNLQRPQNSLRGVWGSTMQVRSVCRYLRKLRDDLNGLAKRLELIHVYSLRDEEGSSFEAAVLDSIVHSFVLKILNANFTELVCSSLVPRKCSAGFDVPMYQETQLQRLEKRKLRDRPALSLLPGTLPHEHARGQSNPEYPLRFRVPDAKVRWDVDWPEYEARQFTHVRVRSNARDLDTGHKWADPELSP
eukprot:3032662-Pleurochrysis_carterae.AAC.3